jgi:hypothetical protein
MVGFAQVKLCIRLLLFIAQPSPIMGVYPLMTINRMMNLHGLVFGILGSDVSPFWIAALTIMAPVLVILWLARNRPSGADAFLYVLIASVALSYYLCFHDSSALFIPIAIALDRFVKAEASSDGKGKVICRLAALLFVFPILMSYIPKYLSLAVVPLLGLLYYWQSYGKEKESNRELVVEVAGASLSVILPSRKFTFHKPTPALNVRACGRDSTDHL